MALTLLTRSSLLIFALGQTCLLTGCDATEPDASNLDDVYIEDRQTRRNATSEELLWVVYADGCAAQMITKEYLLTAAHCLEMIGSQFSSGLALQKAQGNPRAAARDIVRESVVDQSRELDFAILKVRFTDAAAAAAQKIIPLVVDGNQVNRSESPGQGDALFTVGFPADKQQTATYSEGNAKEADGYMLRYNVSTINGNSGGAVFRKSDGMIVGMTNAGPSVMGMPNWDQKQKDDSSSWNFGVASWCIPARSRVAAQLLSVTAVGAENCNQEPQKLPAGMGGGPGPPPPGFPGGGFPGGGFPPGAQQGGGFPGGGFPPGAQQGGAFPGALPGGQMPNAPGFPGGQLPRAPGGRGGPNNLPPGAIVLPDGGILIPMPGAGPGAAW